MTGANQSPSVQAIRAMAAATALRAPAAIQPKLVPTPTAPPGADSRYFRVADYLRAVAADLPSSLVDAVALSEIVELADHLPGTLTSFFGFECPLGETAARADFLLCSTRVEGHARVLAGTHAERLPASLRQHDAWRRVAGFCQVWEDPSSPLHEGILNTWLEFDVATRPDALRVPSMFFGTPVPAADAPSLAQFDVVRTALALLAPEAVVAARGEALARVFAGLPPGCHVFQIGIMWARPTSMIRICLRGVPARQVHATLTALGWPGESAAAVADLITSLADVVVRFDLDLDLGVSLGPRVGIECYLGTDPDRLSRLARMGDYLVARSLCSVEKAASLVRYCGLTAQDARPAGWPPFLTAQAKSAGPDAMSGLARWIHHIKIAYEPGRPLAAKAYLAVEHHLFDRRQLRTMIDTVRAGA